MIEIIDKTKCTGCSACAGICPVKCISMEVDEEGFVYPKVQADKCIHCKVCENVCPVENRKKEIKFEQKGYVVQNKDLQALRESTAGGFYTVLAKYVLKQGGVVFGVELDERLEVRHVFVEEENELWKFRNSKYVQSFVGGDIIRTARDYVISGRLVLFSGTPCQIEGLKSALNCEYDNLITMDVVCRAVPSPLLFKKYIEYEEKKQGCSVEKVIFRDKYYGYKYSTMNVITAKNEGKYHNGVEANPWLRAFFSNNINRPSCYHCAFRKQYRISDFTVWDCFQIERYSKEMDNDKGATRLLIHTNKGDRLFENIKNEFVYKYIEPDELVKTTKEMFCSLDEPDQKIRNEIFLDAAKMNGYELFEKYFPITLKNRAKHIFRKFFVVIGLYSFARKLYVKITHKY